jgi:hypothetical protein
VTFYTDIDSVRVRLKPGGHADFVILLNGKDSCYTQVASAIPASAMEPPRQMANDTIPFTLSAENAIRVDARVNDKDTLILHFDTGSFDFRITRDALNSKPWAKQITKLQMGTLVLNHPQLYTTSRTARGMDGRFGYNLFEGKVVEINYERHWLVISAGLPAGLKDYQKLPLNFTHSFVCLTGAFVINGKTYAGNFVMDTGSDQAAVLDSGWLARLKFPLDLKLLHKSILHDPRGKVYETRIVSAPAFQLGRQKLSDVAVNLLSGPNPSGFEINYLGNDLLKRFDLVFDFLHDNLYIRPNSLAASPYRIPQI